MNQRSISRAVAFALAPLRLALVALALFCVSAPCAAQDQQQAERRSAILFIGDGMGTSQLSLGRMGARRLGRTYHFDRFSLTGLCGTRAQDALVTDSAAAATALATGVKTSLWSLGMDADGAWRETMLEVAHDAGYATGVVTTTRVTHATPAGFTTHVWHRREEREIARQLAEGMSSRGFPQVLMGGGARNFSTEQLDAMSGAEYAVCFTPAELRAAQGPRVVALLASSHLPYVVDGDPERVSLAELTRRAVEALEAEGKPYVLMVEGGRIDHACHQHDAAASLRDQLDFDEAVGWALDRAAQDPNLLIVATADHATGAMGISEDVDMVGLLSASASSDQLARTLGETGRDLGALQAAVERSHGLELTAEDLQFVTAREGGYWSSTALGHVLSGRRGITFYDVELQEDEHPNTHGHDGAAVPLFAAGPEAERFSGLYENDRVPRLISEILGLAAPGRVLSERQAVESHGR
jgi:alkaline phosphatase